MSRPALAALLLHFALACSPADGSRPSATPLFAARLTTGDGTIESLAAYRGQPLLVNFWASWCEPCRTEIPELQRLHRESAADGLVVIGIGLESDIAEAKRFSARVGMTYPSLLAGDAGLALMSALGNPRQALPFTLAIDRSGRIAGQKLGRLQREEATALAAAALAR